MVLYPSTDELRQREQEATASGTSTPTQRLASQQVVQNQNTNSFLSRNQQDLLLAALNSQAGNRGETYPAAGHFGVKRSTSDPQQPDMNGASLFMSPQNAELDGFGGDFTPDLEYLDGDGSFDFDNDLDGDMIGGLPDGSFDGADGIHEKRKSRDGTGEEGDAKRQETQEGEKGAKKPGRKPLTNEPTTKRKAQNRAAQRAFRERKEKHLKDLETKVTELSKAQEADKHENGMLKAQVDRLQSELREYRKRLSLNAGSGLKSSPPLNAYTGSNRSNSGPTYGDSSNFQFEFPKFGALPGSQIFGTQQEYATNPNNGVVQRGSVTPPLTQSPTTMSRPASVSAAQTAPPLPRTDSNGSNGRQSSTPRSMSQAKRSNTGSPAQVAQNFPSVGYSTNNNMHGFASTLPQMGDNPFGDLFSPGLLKTANTEGNSYFNNAQQAVKNISHSSYDSSTGGDSTAGLNRVFQFNSGSSASDSASPSCSSNSQWNGNGANSSCGTSPEPSHDSPSNKTNEKSVDSYADHMNSLRASVDSSYQAPASMAGNPNIALTSNDINYTASTANIFDPVLFGDYRDPSAADFGTTDFSTAFFDDALNPGPYDFGSPSNLFGILQSPPQSNATLNAANNGPANAPTPSRNLMAEMDKARDGGDDDYGLPTPQEVKKTEIGPKLISCNNIWNQLQSNPEFQSGTFDLDSLCSELRAKARCSESGVMVSQDHVDAALKKLSKKDSNGQFVKDTGMPPLMFEQESWDNVLKKLGGGNAQ